MKILSIDPGKSGGMMISDYTHGLLNVKVIMTPMPVLKNKDYHIKLIKEMFDADYDFIVIEDVHSIYGSSARSNFTFGFGVGIVRALAETSKRPYFLTNPKTWQKVAWEGINKVKNPKANSQAAAHRLFPHINFVPGGCRVPNDGLIDAALIGYYGYVKHSNI